MKLTDLIKPKPLSPGGLTPKQLRLLQSLDPEVLAILDLTPVPSQEFKTNQAIAARVEQWIEEARNKPVVKRTISKGYQSTNPWVIVDLSGLPESDRPMRGWQCMAGKTIRAPF